MMKKTIHVKAVIDRPLWTYHPKHKNIFYTLNYGYVEWVMWWDWEEQDVYIMWVDKPLETFEWDVIAIIHRNDDVEEKWVMAPEWMKFTEEEIRKQTAFQEQFFDSEIEMLS
jgi:inorganic pyrophosphatase